MEAASFTPIPVKDKRVRMGTAQLAGAAAGAVLAIVSIFLKAFTVPSGADWTQSTSYVSTGDGKVVVGFAVVGLLFLLLAWAMHRKGVLWGVYVCALGTIALPAIILGIKFTLVGAGPNGSDVKASPAVGVYVALAGGLAMLVSAIAARQSARPLND